MKYSYNLHILHFNKQRNINAGNFCLAKSKIIINLMKGSFGTAKMKYAATAYADEPRHEPTLWFSTRSDTNQAVQLQKMARGLKFRI